MPEYMIRVDILATEDCFTFKSSFYLSISIYPETVTPFVSFFDWKGLLGFLSEGFGDLSPRVLEDWVCLKSLTIFFSWFDLSKFAVLSCSVTPISFSKNSNFAIGI